MVVVLLLPIILVALAAIAMIVVLRRSSLQITAAGVEVRNYPQAPRLIPLPQIARFEATPRAGNFSGIRPPTGVLVLTDGSRVPVRKLSAADAGQGIDALNQRVEALRRPLP